MIELKIVLLVAVMSALLLGTRVTTRPASDG